MKIYIYISITHTHIHNSPQNISNTEDQIGVKQNMVDTLRQNEREE